MIPYMVGKLVPSSTDFTKGLVKYVPGRSYFRAVPSKNRDNFVTSPPPQSLNDQNRIMAAEAGVCQWDHIARRAFPQNHLFSFCDVQFLHLGLLENAFNQSVLVFCHR